jgi:nucleotide-binding universal stress UspA family protein
MFTNVVWATDGSEYADRALEYAAQIAQNEGATLHSAHVIEKLAGGRASGHDARLDENEIAAKIKQQIAAVAAARGIETATHVKVGKTGEAAQRIAEIATEAGADLIVVGTRGHSAIEGLMLGSVTQHLLRLTPCPVLAVPPVWTATPASG